MDRAERDKLYDWLENGRMDVYLRRLIRERLEELETVVAAYAPANETLDYTEPETRHGGAAEALSRLRGG